MSRSYMKEQLQLKAEADEKWWQGMDKKSIMWQFKNNRCTESV